MIIFWILAAGLLGLALSFILVPLLRPEPVPESPHQDTLNLEVFRRRLQELDADLAAGSLDQDSYRAARRDLERDLLQDLDGVDIRAPADESHATGGRPWLLASALAIAVPVTALLLYLQLGDRDIIGQLEAAAQSPVQQPTGPGGQGVPSIEVLVQRLEDRLEENPADLQGWLMLGRTHFALNNAEKGLSAMQRAYELAPEEPEVMLAYAEALAATSPTRSLEGRPAELIQAALERAPDSTSARWLAGMLAYQRGRFEEAIGVWEGILDELEPGGEEATNLGQMIAEARARADLPPPEPKVAQQGTAEAEPTGASTDEAVRTLVEAEPGVAADPAPKVGPSVTAEVMLDARLVARTSPEDTVFVFARAAEGPPMPLAVQRLRVRDLPRLVTLDDTMAMMPAMRLSAFPDVRIGARISKSGAATPRPGDLEGETGPVKTDGNTRVSVTIDRVRP